MAEENVAANEAAQASQPGVDELAAQVKALTEERDKAVAESRKWEGRSKSNAAAAKRLAELGRRRKALRMLIAAAISTRCGLAPRLRLWARRPISLMNGSGLLLFGIRFGMPLMMPAVRMECGFSRVPRSRRKMRSRIVGLAL